MRFLRHVREDLLALGMGTADSECLVHGSSTAEDDPMSIQKCTLHTGLLFVETCLLHGITSDEEGRPYFGDIQVGVRVGVQDRVSVSVVRARLTT